MDLITLESDTYEVITQNNVAITGYRIKHKPTGVSTPWDVGGEGYENYKQLSAALDAGTDIFDSLCSEYFTDGATVYDAEGVDGHMHHGKFLSDGAPRPLLIETIYGVLTDDPNYMPHDALVNQCKGIVVDASENTIKFTTKLGDTYKLTLTKESE